MSPIVVGNATLFRGDCLEVLKTIADNSIDSIVTVKPTDLMRYLCRLVTPACGVVLDLYMGSGSTGKAAMLEGLRFVGIERDEDENGNPIGYMDIAVARINHAQKQTKKDSAQMSIFDEA